MKISFQFRRREWQVGVAWQHRRYASLRPELRLGVPHLRPVGVVRTEVFVCPLPTLVVVLSWEFVERLLPAT